MQMDEIILLVAIGLLFLVNGIGWTREYIHHKRFKKMKKEVRGDDDTNR
jgi:uncharacterized membrane protein